MKMFTEMLTKVSLKLPTKLPTTVPTRCPRRLGWTQVAREPVFTLRHRRDILTSLQGMLQCTAMKNLEDKRHEILVAFVTRTTGWKPPLTDPRGLRQPQPSGIVCNVPRRSPQVPTKMSTQVVQFHFLLFHPAARTVQQKRTLEKVTQRRKVTKATKTSAKVAKRIEEVIELLMPTSPVAATL